MIDFPTWRLFLDALYMHNRRDEIIARLIMEHMLPPFHILNFRHDEDETQLTAYPELLSDIRWYKSTVEDWYVRSPYLFLTNRHTKIRMYTLNYAFKNVCKRIGIQDINILDIVESKRELLAQGHKEFALIQSMHGRIVQGEEHG